MSTDRAAVEALMKRCQIGVGGRNATEDAHDIMAECYGTLGALLIEVERQRQSEAARACADAAQALASWRRAYPDAWGLRDQQALAACVRAGGKA